MGLRTRIKDRLGGLLGGRAEAPASAAPAPPRPVAASPAPANPTPASAAPARPAPPPARPAAPAAAPKALSAEEQAKQDKIAAHFEKARVGVLKHLAEGGGRAVMADMHDFSERRFFIAHQAFSRMMEGYVAEGLIDYDARIGEATITEKGRAYIAAPSA